MKDFASGNRYPSDSTTRSAEDRALSRRWSKTPDFQPFPSADGPLYRQLIDFLRSFVGTPHEKTIWDRFHEWRGCTEDNRPVLETEATEAGLTLGEYLAQLTLEALQRYATLHDLQPKPTSSVEAGPVRDPRLPVVDLEGPTVTVDGRIYVVDWEVAQLFDLLVKAYPMPVKVSNELPDFRLDNKVRNSRLDQRLKDLVVSERGAGTRLVLPPLKVRKATLDF